MNSLSSCLAKIVCFRFWSCLHLPCPVTGFFPDWIHPLCRCVLTIDLLAYLCLNISCVINSELCFPTFLGLSRVYLRLRIFLWWHRLPVFRSLLWIRTSRHNFSLRHHRRDTSALGYCSEGPGFKTLSICPLFGPKPYTLRELPAS